MKKKIVTLFFLAIGIQAFPQMVEFEDISKRDFNGVFNITDQNNSVIGYYTYYKREKEDNGMRLYEFSFTDKDLKKVVKYPLSIHKNAEVNNVVFNGKYMLISYEDKKNKKIVFTTISPEGIKNGFKEFEVDIKMNLDGDFYPSDGDGFYLVKPNIVKNYLGYILKKYDNSLNELWSQEIMPESKGIFKGIDVEDILVSKDRLVIAQNTSLSSARANTGIQAGGGIGFSNVGSTSKKRRLNIVGIDSKSGSKVFDYETYDGSSTPVYNRMKIDSNGDIIVSGTYEDNEYISDVNFDGVFLLKLTTDGKKTLFTKVSYKEKIQEVLKKTSRTSALGSKDKLFLEDIVYEGNSYYIIGEIFKKNVQASNASGALKMVQSVKDLTSGNYMGYDDGGTSFTFQIMDYMVIRFDDKGNYVETTPLIKENYNKISVYYPFNRLPGMRLAKCMSDYGWFDYGFATQQTTGKNIIICSDQSSNKPDVYFYEMDNQFKKSSINLKQRAKVLLDEEARVNYFRVLKNENNKFVAAYYQRKLKKASLTMENIE